MATTPAQAQAEPTAAAAAEVKPSSSLPSQETAATERATKASSPADVRALLSDLRKQKPAPAPAEAKPSTEPAKAETPATTEEAATEETTTEEAKETSEETPVTEEAKGAETTEETEEEENDGGGDGPIEPLSGARTRLRLAEDDKVGRLAASFMKRNKDMPMTEAVARAQKQLGVKPENAPEAEAAAKPKSDLPATVEEVDAEIAKTEDEHAKALIDLRFEDAARLAKSMRKLDRHRVDLEREGERNLVKQESAYNAAFSASESKATDLYEFAGKPESPGYKRMAEIDAALKENDDPLYGRPDKPLKIAQMVAAELGIAPKRKGSAVTPAKAAAPAVITPAPKKQILPGGGSRTTPQVTNPTIAVAEEVGKIANPYQMRNFLKSLGKRK